MSEVDPVKCMRFDLIADAEPEAQLSLVLDFNDDGYEEFDQLIPDVRWKSLQFVVRPPTDYRSLRYILRKKGSGRAVIAQLRVVEETEGCDGPALMIAAGGACTTDLSCASGLCADFICSTCAIPPEGGPAVASQCIDGSACREDSGCQSGACVGRVCQGCALDGSCRELSPCDDASQCASKACVPRLTFSGVVEATSCLHCNSNEDCGGPSALCTDGVCEVCLLDPFPKQCAECTDDAQCSSGVCEAGLCVDCRSDEQCGPGQFCRYVNPFDANLRRCSGGFATNLPRGALCDTDSQCAGGLACGAGAGEPKRCGVACEVDPNVCAAGTICTRPAFSEIQGIIWYPQRRLVAPYADVASNIATCHHVITDAEAAQLPCSLHAECASGVCCDGHCANPDDHQKNLRTGGCTYSPDQDDSE
ncbi:MAG: hypothetical protein QM778_25575 [Myxococcales bacterium]